MIFKMKDRWVKVECIKRFHPSFFVERNEEVGSQFIETKKKRKNKGKRKQK